MLDWLLRHRLAVLGAVFVLLGAVNYRRDSDWQYFTWGSRLLVGEHTAFATSIGHIPAPDAGGLHLYGNYPIVQIGAPALLLARLLAATPPDGAVAAATVITLLGWLAIVAIDRTVGDGRRLEILLGGLLLAPAWGTIVHFGHLDDALALATVAGASCAIVRGRWTGAALLLGLGASCKPWAVAAVPLVLAAPAWRLRLRSILVAATVIAAAWLPFLIADNRTARLGDAGVEFHRASPLAALGLHALTSPGPLRWAQLAGGVIIAAALTLRGAWPAAPLAAFAFRLAIDPMTYAYYGAAVVLGALLLDLGVLRNRLPVITIAATAGWMLAERAPASPAAAMHLATYGLAAVAAVGVAAIRRPPACGRELSPRPRGPLDIERGGGPYAT